MIMNSQDYRTTDLALAAALHTLGFHGQLDKSNKSKVVFIFTRTKDLSEALDNYWSDQLHVEVKNYYHSLRTLKSRLYEGAR